MEALRSANTTITQMPVTNVDSEVVAYGSSIVELLMEGITFCSDADFALRDMSAKQPQDVLDAVAVIVLDTISFFTSRSTPISDERREVAARTNRRFEQTVARFSRIRSKNRELTASELKVRSSLSQRYGTEFPDVVFFF